MDEKRTDESELIWDDESGTPPPMTAAQMDERLVASAARMHSETQTLRAAHEELHLVLLRKAALLEKLEAVWGEIRAERAATDARIAELLAATRALSVPLPQQVRDRVSA